MHRRALHRRKSFWLGLFVLLFLGWAWFSSIHRAHKLRIGSPLAPECLVLGQSSGTVFVTRYHVPSGADLICDELLAGVVTGPFSLWRDRHGSPRYLPPPAASGMRSEVGWSVGIAHWLLILLQVTGWSIWIRWRSRREQHFADPALLGLPSAPTVHAE